jgi:hypothetical protein
LAGALLFDEKIHQSVALFWFGLRDVQILYSRAVIQRTIDVSPHFWSMVWRKRSGFENMQTVICRKFCGNFMVLREFVAGVYQSL